MTVRLTDINQVGSHQIDILSLAKKYERNTHRTFGNFSKDVFDKNLEHFGCLSAISRAAGAISWNEGHG